METLLGGTGDLDLEESDGPTGYPGGPTIRGLAADRGVKKTASENEGPEEWTPSYERPDSCRPLFKRKETALQAVGDAFKGYEERIRDVEKATAERDSAVMSQNEDMERLMAFNRKAGGFAAMPLSRLVALREAEVQRREQKIDSGNCCARRSGG